MVEVDLYDNKSVLGEDEVGGGGTTEGGATEATETGANSRDLSVLVSASFFLITSDAGVGVGAVGFEATAALAAGVIPLEVGVALTSTGTGAVGVAIGAVGVGAKS